MPTNHREDEEIAANELDLEIEPVYDDESIDYSDERVMDFDEDVEDIDLDSLTALEGPDWF
ncbi:MAG TPA: hypothetical protein VLT45_14805 [Kofleriaceae bacterium]|nr:hypothetical protein [Kofleriaceae bacterium]